MLRPFQKRAIDSLKSERSKHLICISPTGSGKSRIFQTFAAENRYRMVLIFPLVALARQQAERLRAFSDAVYLSAGGERSDPLQGVKSGSWIMSPEKLLGPEKPGALERMREYRPDFLIVDECHCIWEWGEDFREAFLALPELISRFSIPKSLWLTATLPPPALESLLSRLPLAEVQGEFALPTNLYIQSQKCLWMNRAEALISHLLRLDGAGVVFCETRKSSRRVYELLQTVGENVVLYHAGLSLEEKKITEKMIACEEARVVVATSAFGMGMNYPQLKWAVFWQAPLSLLSLAQRAGRVGRNSERAEVILLWDEVDFRMNEWAAKGSKRRRDALKQTYDFYRSGEDPERYLLRFFRSEPKTHLRERRRYS